MNNTLTQLIMLCLFNLLGGIAIGFVVRGAVRGKFACNSFFFLLWGAMFGGLPFLFGFQEMQKGVPYFLPIQVAVFLVAILVVTVIPEDILQTLRSPSVSTIAIGGLFFVLGSVMMFTNLFDLRSMQEKFLAGGLFFLIGIMVFARGLWLLLKS